MIYTNTEEFGNKLLDVVDRQFSRAKSVTVASGYTSLDILQRYANQFLRIAEQGGQSRLLIGMAFYEGLTQKKLDILNRLSIDLQRLNSDSGVFVCYSRKFHGKIYRFEDANGVNMYLGSSNFSRSGLSENIEATVPLEQSQIPSTSNFLDFLFNQDNAALIEKADIVVPGSSTYKNRISVATLDDLERYDPSSISTERLTYFDYSLARVAGSEKSSLNVYFGKGRWARSTGRVNPRPWYEVELIAPKAISTLEVYPKGDFTAYTDNGYIIPMTTNGDYNKNIRSKGNLKLLGMWLKKKLQDSGALLPLTPVTQDTLDQYGVEDIRFYKLSDGKYFLKF